MSWVRGIRKRVLRMYRWVQDNPTLLLGYIFVLLMIIYFSGWVHVLAENAPPYLYNGQIFSKNPNFQTLAEAIFVSILLAFGVASLWILYSFTARTYYRGNPTVALGIAILLFFISFLALLIVAAT